MVPVRFARPAGVRSNRIGRTARKPRAALPAADADACAVCAWPSDPITMPSVARMGAILVCMIGSPEANAGVGTKPGRRAVGMWQAAALPDVIT